MQATNSNTTCIIQLLLISILLLSLSSCMVNIPYSQVDSCTTTYNKLVETIKFLNKWYITGRILIIEDDHIPITANFYWQQIDSEYQINIIGSMGLGRIFIKGSGYYIKINLSDSTWMITNNLPIFLKNTEIYIPIGALQYWLIGIPVPNLSYSNLFCTHGRITHLVQNGWTVDYKDYVLVNDIYVLPVMISLQNNNLLVKLVINKWLL